MNHLLFTHEKQLCESYPQKIAVPKNVTDAELLLSAQFRKNKRLPVVTWKHRNNSILSHGSIPDPTIDIKMTNLPAKSEDEKVFMAIIQNSINDHRGNSFSPPSTPKKIKKGLAGSLLSMRKSSPNVIAKLRNNERGFNFFIIDVCQKTDVGKLQKEFFDTTSVSGSSNLSSPLSPTHHERAITDNIAIGRDTLYLESLADLKESHRKIHKLCSTSSTVNIDDHWYSAIDSTHWLQHCQNVMVSALRVVQILSMGCSLYLSCNEDKFVLSYSIVQ